jgi:hypothetical protein
MAIITSSAYDIREVSDQWIFQTYCNISESLTGQKVIIKSPFNPNDKTPSFVIYFGNTGYRFKDFSTGRQGTGIDFIKYLYDIDYHAAVALVLEAYNNADTSASQKVITAPVRYDLSEFVLRNWNNIDAKYWSAYNISSKVLDYYNVKPLASYKMKRSASDGDSEITIAKEMLYLYTRIDGTPYKIYRPNNENKFLKLKSYIQGTDQIKYNQPNLIITKSLKDIMTLSTFGYNAEYIAPESENVIIPQVIINMHKAKYKSVCTLFDNDPAGLNAKALYKDVYNIDGIIMPDYKDPSESVSKQGFEKTRSILTPLLKEVLKK